MDFCTDAPFDIVSDVNPAGLLQLQEHVCPFCRAEFDVPEGGEEQFPTRERMAPRRDPTVRWAQGVIVGRDRRRQKIHQRHKLILHSTWGRGTLE